MSSDFSFFITKENIIFLVISVLIVLVFLAVFFVAVKFIIEFAINIFKKIFCKKKPKKDDGSDLNVNVRELEESKEERAKLEQKKVATATTSGPKLDYRSYSKDSQKKDEQHNAQKTDQKTYDEKEQKEIAAGLDRLKNGEEQESSFLDQQGGVKDEADATGKVKLGSAIKVATATTSGPKLDMGGRQEEINSKNLQKHSQKIYDEKGQKEITAGLDRLKNGEEQESSFLDQQGGIINDDKKNLGSTIDVPVSKRLGVDEKNPPKEIMGKPGPVLKYVRPDAKNQPVIPEVKESLPKESLAVEKLIVAGKKNREKRALSEKNSDKSDTKIHTEDNIMFGDKEEVSRTQLRERLESSKVFLAEKQVGLNLSPVERAKLEKQVFSQSLGQNISKKDLKWGIRKLNQKYIDEKNPVEKAKLRKEIKFFKKIGGLK